MKKLFISLLASGLIVGVCSASDYVGTIKNKKGQTIGKLRNSQNRVEVLNKNGFVQGWIDKKTGRTFDKRGFSTGAIVTPKNK
jgi:hypothetical protein